MQLPNIISTFSSNSLCGVIGSKWLDRASFFLKRSAMYVMLMPWLNNPPQTKKVSTSQMKAGAWKMSPHKILGTFQEVEP